MRTSHIYFTLIILCAFILLPACTPTVRVSQSQQGWNEYKGKDVKQVVRVKKHKNRN